MLRSTALLLILLLFSTPARAYFDPGYGGYLANSIISIILTTMAGVCAFVIYFFRERVGRIPLKLWQKYPAMVVCIPLALLGAAAGRYLRAKLAMAPEIFMNGIFFDPRFSTHLVSSIVLLAFVGLLICGGLLQLGKLTLRLPGVAMLGLIVMCASAYVAASTRHQPDSGAPLLPAVNIIDPQRSFKGYDLSGGRLSDELGRTVKQWSRGHLGVIDENGDYYGASGSSVYEGSVWGRYSWDDKLIWEKQAFVHHEIYLSPKGTIFTFTHDLHTYNGYKVAFDVILEYDKLGRELGRYALWDHLKEYLPLHPRFAIDVPSGLVRFFSKLMTGKMTDHYDYFHLNSFFMIPPNALEGLNPAFRPGNWLISLFHGSMVVILDQDTKKILWHAANRDIEGQLDGQHAASMLANGDVLLFDNGVNRKASRILIIDPRTLKVVWQYSSPNFWSMTGGHVQSLPNGNLMVTESNNCRAFEVTPDKRIVWERYWDDPSGPEIYRVTRYPKEMIDYFLQVTGEIPSFGPNPTRSSVQGASS